jgi:predicted esterase
MAEQPMSGSNKTTTTSIYPKPVTIFPSAKQTRTILVLHGRGSNGDEFSEQFLASKTSSDKSIKDMFPGVKWIFPTASKRRASAFNRAIVRQWFDIYSLERQNDKAEVQYQGLEESCAFLHQLIDEEVGQVGPGNVVLGGLSMGCALGVWAALSYQESQENDNAEVASSLGGFFGMSGWLPFAPDIRNAALLVPTEDDFFGESDCGHGQDDSAVSRHFRAVNFIRDIINLPLVSRETVAIDALQQMPIFLGHGSSDEKVPIELGKQCAQILGEDIGLDVTFKEHDIGHWWKEPDEIDDLIEFLKIKAGVTADGPV